MGEVVPTFADLHHGDQPLVLPNAWDVPSALAFRAQGFSAIGTTSFGVAASHGRPDGARATRDLNPALAQALTTLGCPISMDIEDGYSDDPNEVAAYIGRLPVDGINIEDSTEEVLIDPDRHAAKIAAVKDSCPQLFVNARVDTYWLNQDATVTATLQRAAKYVAAGADGIFIPGLSDASVIRDFAGALTAPLNVLAVAAISLSQMAELGVRRVSTGSLPYRVASFAATAAVVAVRDGDVPPAATGYSELQDMLLEHTHIGRIN